MRDAVKYIRQVKSITKYFIKCVLWLFFPNKASWHELKIVTRKLAKKELHFLYDLFVYSFDRSFKLKYKTNVQFRSFFGYGEGSGSLNTYRKIQKNGIVLLEKTYKRDSLDWKKTHLFYDQFYAKTKTSGLNIPNLVDFALGNKVIKALFEFVDITHPPKELAYDRGLKVTFSLHQCIKHTITCASLEVLTNFEEYDARFKERYSSYKTYFNQKGDLFHDFNEHIFFRLSGLPKGFQHGDLNYKNLDTNHGYVIDWDLFGFYPIGFDIANALYHKYILKTYTFLFLKKEILRTYLHYRKIETNICFDCYQLSVCFFLSFFLYKSKKNSLLFLKLSCALRKILNSNHVCIHG